MDYPEEVRRRQQAALASLLLGSAEERKAQDGESGQKRTDPRIPNERAAADARSEDASAETARSAASRRQSEGEAEFERFRRADRLWRDHSAYGGEGTEWLVFPDGETSDASALSRAFERDARRYDGAFSAD